MWLSGPYLLRNSPVCDVTEVLGDDENLPELRKNSDKSNVLITVSPVINYIGDIINIE